MDEISVVRPRASVSPYSNFKLACELPEVTNADTCAERVTIFEALKLLTDGWAAVTVLPRTEKARKAAWRRWRRSDFTGEDGLRRFVRRTMFLTDFPS
jgi:hypothetical protein